MSSSIYATAVLSIAGSDPSAGAGIQADLKTFAAMGVYGCAVITALTAQSSRGVSGVWGLEPGAVSQQIAAILADIPIAAIKTGMLYNGATILEVVEQLKAHPHIPLVVDPVICASSGALLLVPEDIPLMIARLLPLATVLTPNLDEAAELLHRPIANDVQSMQEQAISLLALGPQAVLLKGGHLPGKRIVDVLVWREAGQDHEHQHAHCQLFESERIDTPNTHGTGCALSSALAAGIGQGMDLISAVKAARDFVHGALSAGRHLRMGDGKGPLHHLYGMSIK